MNRQCRTFPERESVSGASLPRLLYSRKEAAFMLSMSVRSLDYLIAEGRIRARQIGGRVLIHHQDLERLARDGDREAIKPAAA